MHGTPFGRYRLIELLGRGGMGEVWRAYDTDTDRIVALKLLPAHFSENEDFQQRFRREAHAAARLNSPHVIPIHHYGEIDGRLYVDMRLIEGRDLQTVLADGPLEPSRAVHIIEQVAKALHTAHEFGLLHRDVKPSNILLDRDDFAYLIDFGIARAADETRLTKSGNAIGTFQYIAPERLGTRKDEDARADIYSLACVLYECLTGHPPFDDDTMAQLVVAHLNTPPPQPSTTRPNVPAELDDVIATGMAKDPDQRYATTIALAGAARDAITVPIRTPARDPAATEAPSAETTASESSTAGRSPAPAPGAASMATESEMSLSRNVTADVIDYPTATEARNHAAPTVSAGNAPTQQAPVSAPIDSSWPAPGAPAAERRPKKRMSRRTKIVIGAVTVLLVVGGVSVGIVIQVQRSEKWAGAPGMLLSKLPTGYSASNCEPHPEARLGSITGVYCGDSGQPGAPRAVRFWLFGDDERMTAGFEDITSAGTPACPGETQTWAHGQVRCNYVGILWTDQRGPFVGEALGSATELWNWFENYAAK